MAPPLGERTNVAQPSVGLQRSKPSPSECAATPPAVPTPAPAAEATKFGDAGLTSHGARPALDGALQLDMDAPLPQASSPAQSLPPLAIAAPADGDSTPRWLAAEAAAASPAGAGTSAPTTAATSAASSSLNSPLAAFAAARARLARSTRDADRLLHSTLAALNRLDPQAAAARASSAADAVTWPEEASERGSSRGSSRASTPRLPLPTPSGSAAPAGGSALSAVAALHQRNLRLRERMSTSLALCHALHEQNRESMEKVAQLCSSKQRLSKSLQDARLDKEGLQSTIRQLTAEAALLAEHARRALLPSAAPSPRSVAEAHEQLAQGQDEVPVSPCSLPAMQQQQQHTEQQKEQTAQQPEQADDPAEQPAELQQPHLAEGLVQAEQLVGQHSQEPAAQEQGAVATQGAQEQTAEETEVQAAQEPGTEPFGSPAAATAAAEHTLPLPQQVQAPAEVAAPGTSSSEPAAAAATYVQAVGSSGDKRRRVAPGLLLDVPRSEDEPACDAGNDGLESPRCRLPTPGDTPKRKLRRSSTSSGTPSAGSGVADGTVLAAADDPAAEPPAAAAAAVVQEPENAGTAQQQAEPEQPARAAASDAVVPLPQAEAPAWAAEQGSLAPVAEEQEWETFRLFDQKWFGGSSGCSATSAVAVCTPQSLSRLSSSDGGCAMM
ncbi:hypothetical protein ABPG75_010208 [Micractinium tetrahymenae]